MVQLCIQIYEIRTKEKEHLKSMKKDKTFILVMLGQLAIHMEKEPQSCIPCTPRQIPNGAEVYRKETEKEGGRKELQKKR